LSELDKELVARAKAGNTAAFDELIAMHQDRVFALAYRMLGNREDAADVQQSQKTA
jgi:RNA polymerase sigma-70 factor (ECF subfamily)